MDSTFKTHVSNFNEGKEQESYFDTLESYDDHSKCFPNSEYLIVKP